MTERNRQPHQSGNRRRRPARQRPRGTCVWPSCPLDGWNEMPLCTMHLSIAADLHRDLVESLPRVVRRRDGECDVLPSIAQAREAATSDAPKIGVIYFARNGGNVKIGWTSHLEKRMKAYPPDTQLLAVKPGTRSDERQMHRRFAHLLTHGREWFPLAPQITEEVDRIVREHGAPPVVDFAAKRATRIVGPRLTGPVGGNRIGTGPTRVMRG